MNYQTIADVYAANDKIRERLKETVRNLTDEQLNYLPEGEKWTVAQIVEHLSLVEDGMTRISAKLLNEAKENGKASDGTVKISEDFLRKIGGARQQKFEAPERAHPKSGQTVPESLAKMEENRKRLNELCPLFESVECADYKFPHPAFGELTAHEWLALLGGHEMRHIEQIKRILKGKSENVKM
jgi:uncharacterized damage-inducible protein DinB